MDSQEMIIEKLLVQEAGDPLNYKEFDYDKGEWDNIPIIIPRFSLYLSKHMEALSGKCRSKFNEETTAHLRDDVFDKFGVSPSEP